MPQQQAGTLRPADGLPSTIGYHGGPALKVHVGDGEHLGGGVNQYRNVPGFCNPGDRLQPKWMIGSIRQGIDHCRFRSQRIFEFFDGIHGHEPDADVADGVIVFVAGMPGYHDLGFVEAREVGYADELLRISSGDAGRGHVLQPRGASRGNHSPFGAGQLSQSPAYAVGQLVILDKIPRGRVHRHTHFRPFN